MSGNPYQKQESVGTLNMRNRIGFVVGVLAAIAGVALLIDLVLSPWEVCNQFRCIRQYDTGGILLGLGLVVVGVWFAWSAQQSINRRTRNSPVPPE